MQARCSLNTSQDSRQERARRTVTSTQNGYNFGYSVRFDRASTICKLLQTNRLGP
jgi:hypothetical protein